MTVTVVEKLAIDQQDLAAEIKKLQGWLADAIDEVLPVPATFADAVTFEDTVTAEADLTVGTTLDVTGASTLDDVTVGGDLAVTGAAAFTVMPTIPCATVAALGTNQGNAAPIATGFTLVTAADDAVGVVLPAAAAGKVCIVKSSVSNKILKVWPASGDAINALGANNVLSLASGPTVAMFVSYDATTWYTLPLLPS